MNAHVPQFQFRLRHGSSIGPVALKRLWSAACGCDDVTVSREPARAASDRTGYRYSLWGPPHRFDLVAVEARLQLTLRARFPEAHVMLFRLDSVPRPKR